MHGLAQKKSIHELLQLQSMCHDGIRVSSETTIFASRPHSRRAVVQARGQAARPIEDSGLAVNEFDFSLRFHRKMFYPVLDVVLSLA